MPAARSTRSLSAKVAAKEDASTYKPSAKLRSAKRSKNTSDDTTGVNNSSASGRVATTLLPPKKVTRERRIKKQTAKLEDIYGLTEDHPAIEQTKKTTQDIGK
jgi:hypothetical protein